MPVRKQVKESRVPSIAVSLAEASRLLSVGETAIFELISTGRLKSKKLGGRTLVLVTELERFARSLPDRPVTRATSEVPSVGHEGRA